MNIKSDFVNLKMKSPIHVKCARSGELCDECRRKLDSGEYSELDVKLTDILSRIEEKHNLTEIEFVRSIDLGNVVYILVKSNVSQLIGKNARILKEIKKELNRKVRIVNISDEETAIEDVIHPAKPKYISKVFNKGGRYMKIVLPREELTKLPASPKALEQALERILGIETRIIGE